MARITQTNAFEAQTLLRGADTATQTVLKTLRPFVDYVNGLAKNLVFALSGEIVLGENIKGKFVTGKLVHATATKLALDALPGEVHGLLPLSCSGNTIYGVDWTFVADGSFQVTAYMRNTSDTTARDVVFFAFLK